MTSYNYVIIYILRNLTDSWASDGSRLAECCACLKTMNYSNIESKKYECLNFNVHNYVHVGLYRFTAIVDLLKRCSIVYRPILCIFALAKLVVTKTNVGL